MILRSIMGVVLILSLTGCITTQKPTTTGQLQIRVAHLENQLDDQNQEISQLRAAVEVLSQQPKAKEVVIVPPKKTKQATKPKPVESSSSRYKNVLRVPVTPKDVQIRLRNAGYYTGSIDGKLGSASKRAIKEFQTDHDLESDGIIGKKTWAELKNYLD